MEKDTRNGKRRSVGRQDLYGSSVERRLSKKSTSQDRHGKVYPDNFRDRTIRAVTPDSATRDESMSETDADYPQSATSPSPQSNSRGATSERLQKHSASLANTDDERSSVDVKRKQSRKNNKSPDGGAPTDVSSSPSIFSKTRNRLGSITTSSPFNQNHKAVDDHVGSIGYPSIHSPPLSIHTGSRTRLVKPNPSAMSPPFGSESGETSLRSPVASTDSNKILTLMNTTCGRMHGILSFRATGSSSWTTGYCAINVATGSLICQVKGEPTTAKTLVPDLRGCSVRTFVDSETQSTCLNVSTASSGLGIQIKPQVPETFDSWLAALLCWQPIRPKGVQNKMTKPQLPAILERKPNDRRRSESNPQRNATIIKVGRMRLWESYSGVEAPISTSTRRVSTFRRQPALSSNWQRVSCTLHENGHFKLLTEADAQPIYFIQLSQLSRCAVQQLDASVLGEDFCIALYPQYTAQSGSQMQPKSIFLCLESRVLFEVWFVLLRAFTVPELYGPEQSMQLEDKTRFSNSKAAQKSDPVGMFRVERLLAVRLIEAKMKPATSDSPILKRGQGRGEPEPLSGDFYSEILLDGEIRGRTAIKTNTSKPFWREDFNFLDLPPVLSSAAILLKAKNSAEKEWTMVAHGNYSLSHGEANNMAVTGDIEVSMHDSVCGKVELQLDDLDRGLELEKWWSILDSNDHLVGELFMKVRLDETIVLMTKDYSEISTLLHTFANGLTVRIATELSTELKPLSEVFLDIFQVSAHVSEWMMSLVEDEIDGNYRESTANRLRYSGRVYSSDTYDAGPDRELLVRDMGRSAATEANLLFRGNTLLTRALDSHMRRLGKEYLLETLGERLRDIDEHNYNCEVDPNRVSNPEERKRNWKTLISLTTSMWKSISASASRCPAELRLLFRHVRSCAEDRYGDFLRTVSYSSVSGFLFLRFFCPAVLNPKLFGLLQNHPQPQANRTLTLIAKSLMTLANMTQFGGKEPWMEPMNKFLTFSRPEFKTFVDQICSIPAERPTQAVSPSYATPIQILGRLPPTSREGFPSLPFLIDSAKNFSALVNLWLSRCAPATIAQLPDNDALRIFHDHCIDLQRRTNDCLAQAEQAERPSGGMQSKWEQLLEEREKTTTFYDEATSTSKPSTPSNETTAMVLPFHGAKRGDAPGQLPGPFSPPQAGGTLDDSAEETPPSSASLTWDQTRMPFTSQGKSGETRASTSSSKNSSTVSFDPSDSGRSRPLPPTRELSAGKTRFLDFTGRSSRKKGKDREGSTTPREEYRNEF